MRSVLSALVLVVLLASCGNTGGETISGDDSLLSADLVYNPATSGSGTGSARGTPVLQFTDTAHDFGTVREGEKVEFSFPYTNAGDAPLLITGADATCGCTVPDYPRDPLAPGKGGVIRVTFNSAGKPGHQEKTITVGSNSARSPQYLKIIAEVQPAE